MLAGTLTLVNGVSADVHPLAYYTLLWGWMRLFGESLLAVRALSILFGAGVILLVYLLAKSVGLLRVAIPATILTAISPFQIHYAQEIRMYALLALLLMIASWALWQGMHTGRWYWWGVFACSSALAQYNHNLAFFYLLPLAFTPFFWRRWRSVLSTLLSGSLAVLFYLPWLLHLPGQFARVQSGYWISRPGFDRVVTTLLSFNTNLPLPEAWLPGALFVAILSCMIAGRQTLRAYRLRLPGYQAGLWFLYLAFIPASLLFIFSQWRPVYIERALLASGVMYLLWLAWALFETNLAIPIQRMTTFLLVLTFGAGYYQHLTYRGFPYAPYPQMMQALELRLIPGDVILHSNKLTMLPSVFYARNLPQEYVDDPPGSGADTLAEPTQKTLGLYARPNVEDAVGEAQRVWFVIFTKAIDEYRQQGYASHPHLEWLQEHYRLQGVETWDEVRLYQFVR